MQVGLPQTNNTPTPLERAPRLALGPLPPSPRPPNAPVAGAHDANFLATHRDRLSGWHSAALPSPAAFERLGSAPPPTPSSPFLAKTDGGGRQRKGPGCRGRRRRVRVGTAAALKICRLRRAGGIGGAYMWWQRVPPAPPPKKKEKERKEAVWGTHF